MGYTKRQFVNAAFDEIGFASYEYDMDPGQLQSAVRRLDAMLASWHAAGIRLSYPLPSSPELTDLDTESAVPDMANEAIICNLAIKIAPSVGKQASAHTLVNAREALQVLEARLAEIPERQMPGSMPAGAGNKPWRDDSAFLDTPSESLNPGPDSAFDFS